MIFIKIIILGMIFGICTLLGIKKAQNYVLRVEELRKLKSSIEILRSKIEFTYEPIYEIFLEISRIMYSDKKNIFKDAINRIEENNNVSLSWNEAVDDVENFTQEDKKNIKLFGKLLGKTDKSGQINEINLMSKILDGLIENAEMEKNKNYKLFKSLGMTIGIGMCILLI